MPPPSPIPIAQPAPLLAPNIFSEDNVSPGDTVQDPSAPQNAQAFSSSGSIATNGSLLFYVVPAGKIFVITSCFITTNGTTGQYIALKNSSTVIAEAYTGGITQVEMVTSPLTVGAGGNIKVSAGTGPQITAKITGYLTDPTQYGAPNQTQPAPSPTLG